MKALTLILASVCLSFAAASAGAADDTMMKKDNSMAKDGMDKPMTMQDCKDHMTMMGSPQITENKAR